VTLPSTLPRTEWAWTPDGRRVRVWIWPQVHPLEMDIDVSDLAPADAAAEGSDLHAAEFGLDNVVTLDTETAMDVMLDTETALDEFALDALLVQCDCQTKTGQRRGGK
jgi:hypothetical protein